MVNAGSLLPDHWLIASADAYRSLLDFWSGEAGPRSMLAWRFASGSARFVANDELQDQVQKLGINSGGSVHLVVDHVDEHLLRSLKAAGGPRALEIFEWKDAPLVVVLTMNAPDQALIARLDDGATLISQPTDNSAALPLADHYFDALKLWEKACRANDPEQFGEAFPQHANKPIDWQRLVVGEVLDSKETFAANDNWVSLNIIAAASTDAVPETVNLDDPQNIPAQWRLTLSLIDGGPETLILFRANSAALSSFVGCQIKLQIGGEEVNLGEVDDGGQAEVVVAGPVELKGIAVSWSMDE